MRDDAGPASPLHTGAPRALQWERGAEGPGPAKRRMRLWKTPHTAQKFSASHQASTAGSPALLFQGSIGPRFDLANTRRVPENSDPSLSPARFWPLVTDSTFKREFCPSPHYDNPAIPFYLQITNIRISYFLESLTLFFMQFYHSSLLHIWLLPVCLALCLSGYIQLYQNHNKLHKWLSKPKFAVQMGIRS